MKIANQKIKRLNLVLDEDFFNHLQKQAKADYLPTGTYVKQFLMRHLWSPKKIDVKPLNRDV